MAVQLTYTGTPFADEIRQQGFKPGKPTGGFGLRFADLFQRGPKTFTTPNFGVASLYGKTIPVVSSMSNLRLPSGAIPGKTFLESLKNIGGTKFGTEVIQTPKQATKGMQAFERMTDKFSRTPTYQRMVRGVPVSGFGTAAAPGFLKTAARTVLGPLSTVTLGPQVIAGLMTPSVMRGDFASDEDFQLGQSELGLGEFFTNQDFNRGFVSGAPGITNTSVANNLDPNVVAAIDAQTADEQAQLPIDPVDNRNIFSRIKDFAAPIAKDIAGRTIASQALGGAGGMLFGLPGALLGTIFGGIKGGGLFDAPYIGGVTTVDEFGNLISGEELDKLNAAGGYYTDAARASRRRDARIANMRERQALGKRISEANLARLEAQQAREEAARQAEAAAIQDANRAAGTGGYQSSFAQDSDFMEGDPSAGGQATTATMGSFKQGGIVGLL